MIEPPRRFIRLLVGWDESEWLDAISGHASGCWPRLLCYVKRNGSAGRCKTAAPAVLARHWKVDLADVVEVLGAALEHGALICEAGDWIVPNWTIYQPADPTAPERQRKFRSEQIKKNPLRSSGVTQIESNGHADPPRWMHDLWQQELGGQHQLNMTVSRRQLYLAMYAEQLEGTPNPPLAWRAVLTAVKRSPHHMSVRGYQMPESLLKDADRRSRWVEEAVAMIDRAKKKSTEAEDFAADYRAKHNGNGAHP